MIAWGAAGVALAGQPVSGDGHLVAPFRGGTLVAVVDGLGHGREAAAATGVALAVLGDAPDAAPALLIERCHDALRSTRGAVVTVASFRDDATVTWLGVGNVDAFVVRGAIAPTSGRESITLRGGIVGHRLPPLVARTLPLWPGDTLVAATDGIRSGFHEAAIAPEPPQVVAERILARWTRDTDDAHVLVARYEPPPAVEILAVAEASDPSVVRRAARTLAARQGLDERTAEALATALSELAHNILTHAGRGEIELRAITDGTRTGVLAIARDDGPGIPDVARAMTDGFTTGGGLGLGLASARRLVDELELTTEPGRGTEIVLRQWRTR